VSFLKTKFIFLLFYFSFATVVQAQTFYGSTDLKTFRVGRDKEIRSKEESPLKPEDFPGFKGLNYFRVDKSFRVRARLTPSLNEKYFQMPTSSGKTKKFIKYGKLNFKLNGKKYSLSVYQAEISLLEAFPEYKDLLFIPFKDLTNGRESYGGGRYIDIKNPAGKSAIIDFNLAYNPSCAYGSDKYSCPIPPKENFLQVKIKAGEKTYLYSGSKH
jgi:uncharacterized protein (DUF1684 family)